MRALEFLATAIRLCGFLVTLVGLWRLAGSLRVVVSGRIDERRQSANSLRWGIPLMLVGVLLLAVGFFLKGWATN